MNIILLAQIAVSVILTILILIQSKGGGLGAAFGGANLSHSRRGIEKTMFRFTIGLVAIFTVLSIASLI